MQAFNRSLELEAVLPEGIAVLDPFRSDPVALASSDAFYERFYKDAEKRHAILGINPGRHGGGLTGVPFTDFKRLRDVCGIDVAGRSSHEPSSEFIYAMIAACGGVEFFYRHFYINSVCPLGFIRRKGAGWVNYNYYDDAALWQAARPFILRSLQRQIDLGLQTGQVFCMGKKNAEFLQKINEEAALFGAITVLPHPRFIVQYQRRNMDAHIDAYRQALLPALEQR